MSDMDILAIAIVIILPIAAWNWALKDSNGPLGKIHAALIEDLKDIKKCLEAAQKGSGGNHG